MSSSSGSPPARRLQSKWPAHTVQLNGTWVTSSLFEGMTSRLVFRSVRLFDGVDMHDEVDVSVTDGRIDDIGARLRAGDRAEVIDGEGCALLPGLIDAHTHTWGAALHQAVVF